MATKMSAAEREKMYTEYLRAEGYRPDLEQDGSVAFKKESETYFIIVDDDAGLFFIMLPYLSLKGDRVLAAKALKAALHATDKSKVAKVYLEDDSVFFTVQLFLDPPESFRAVIERCMTALVEAEKFYQEAMA
jgi:hypothetical protein